MSIGVALPAPSTHLRELRPLLIEDTVVRINGSECPAPATRDAAM